MPEISRFEDSVEVGTDPQFERKWWLAERIIWAIMALLLVAGMAGVFGRGPLSRTVKSAPGSGISIEYDRFLRYHSPAKITVTFTPGSIGLDEEIRLGLNNKLAQTIGMGQTMPQPVLVRATSEGMLFVFTITAEPGRSDTITFTQSSDSYGLINGSIAITGKEPVEFSQFVYP